MAKKILDNVRINPETGEQDYYFPLEITDDSILAYAREHNLEVVKFVRVPFFPATTATRKGKGRGKSRHRYRGAEGAGKNGSFAI